MQLVRLLLALSLLALAVAQSYKVGVGIYDVTGTPAQANLMGYAMPQQKANGVHLRQRSRAFIFADSANDTNRVVFVSSDICMVFQEVKAHVVEKLQALFPGYYTLDNVMLSGTHTHSGPAGFAYYLLYDISSWGFIAENFGAIVSGIVSAISMAHNNLADGNIYLERDFWPVANWTSANRSPSSYLQNPDANPKIWTDTNMTLLRLQNSQGKDIGMVNWFAVHGTSMNNSNGLISGDNKGYSAYLFERMQNGITSDGALPGMGPYVAAFAQANEGDVSPNTMGAHCPDGTPCSWNSSTCNGRTEMCRATGPGATDFESCQIIGERIFNFSLELFQNATQSPPLTGPLTYIHQWIPMYNITVEPPYTWDGKVHQTCIAALGDGFAGGTTDGPGAFDFKQGGSNPFWNFIGGFLSEPTAAERACQAQKSILLNVGGIDLPAPWAPNILPFQIFRLGNLFILGIPGELTTQSGRRLKGQMEATLRTNGIKNGIVVLAGLSNSYSHYIATPEEYVFQRYEAASTLYGPATLGIYLQEFTRLMNNLLAGTPVSPGPPPPNLNQTYTFFLPVVMDRVPDGKQFGDVIQDVSSSYSPGDIVLAVFYGANPRNNLHTQGSYLFVERLDGQNWTVVAVDGDWETKFHWLDAGELVSQITIEWDIPTDPAPTPGTYRLRYTGDAKTLGGTINPFEGISSEFTVQSS